MSALEQFIESPGERRRAPRLRVQDAVTVRIGRGEGTLVDISARGARVRHTTAVGRGTTVRVAFDWHRRRFTATAEVLSSRIVALDGPTYESRLRFATIPQESEDVLAHVLQSIENEDLRRALANMRGWSESKPDVPSAPSTAGFIRCRYLGGRWVKKWTRDAAQPDDGFTLPAALSEIEIAQVCRSYERIDPDARVLLRMIAGTIVAA